MLRKLFALLLVVFMINLAGVRLAYAESKEEKQARFAEKVTANVLNLGTGESARVKGQAAGSGKARGLH